MKIERFETAAAGADIGGDKISDQYEKEIRELLEASNLYGSAVTSDPGVWVLCASQDGSDWYGTALRHWLLQSADSPEDYDTLTDSDLAGLGNVRPVLV